MCDSTQLGLIKSIFIDNSEAACQQIGLDPSVVTAVSCETRKEIFQHLVENQEKITADFESCFQEEAQALLSVLSTVQLESWSTERKLEMKNTLQFLLVTLHFAPTVASQLQHEIKKMIERLS